MSTTRLYGIDLCTRPDPPTRPPWWKRLRGGTWHLVLSAPYYVEFGMWRERWLWFRQEDLNPDWKVETVFVGFIWNLYRLRRRLYPRLKIPTTDLRGDPVDEAERLRRHGVATWED